MVGGQNRRAEVLGDFTSSQKRKKKAPKLSAYQHKERTLQDVIEVMKEMAERGEHVVVQRVAKEYDVPYSTLKNRWQGKHVSLHDRPPPRRRLAPEQELALVKYANQRDKMGLSIPVRTMRDVADRMLFNSLPAMEQNEYQPVSDMWTIRFMKRNKLKKIKRKSIELAPKETSGSEQIKAWYPRYEACLTEYQIRPSIPGTSTRLASVLALVEVSGL